MVFSLHKAVVENFFLNVLQWFWLICSCVINCIKTVSFQHWFQFQELEIIWWNQICEVGRLEENSYLTFGTNWQGWLRGRIVMVDEPRTRIDTLFDLEVKIWSWHLTFALDRDRLFFELGDPLPTHFPWQFSFSWKYSPVSLIIFYSNNNNTGHKQDVNNPKASGCSVDYDQRSVANSTSLKFDTTS